MKTIITIITLLAIGLTGCAFNQDAYYKAIEARENRLAQQELRIDSAITDMAAAGGPEAKGMGIAYFIGKSSGAKQSSPIPAPESWGDGFLRWSSVFVPVLDRWYSAKKNADVQMHLSDNALAGKGMDNEMIVDLVQGRKTPIVGGEGDVLLYPN
jgi:hypothetical protein